MRTQKIDYMLPSAMVEPHRQRMVNFKRTGVSNLLGTMRNLFAMHKNSPQPIRAVIKVFPSIEGLMFSGCFQLVNDSAQYVLLDNNGNMQEYPDQLESIANRNDVLISAKEIFRGSLGHDDNTKLRTKSSRCSKLKGIKISVEYLTIDSTTLGICRLTSPNLHRNRGISINQPK